MRNVERFSLSAAICVSVTCVSGISSPALAKSRPILVNAPPEEIVVRSISYADLNLAVPAGERSLMSRVGSAVNGLCGDVAGGYDGSYVVGLAVTRCVSATWQQARPQIDLALQRAHEIASTGKSSIAAAALILTAPMAK
ncbi:MAG TPA: UrcA family protein [Sphingomicrobium sp.]|nr:UrcA family protein [Sphingomicrobium sp.]